MSLALAHEAFDRGDYEQAAAAYTNHLLRFPHSCAALVSLAASVYHLGDLQSAVARLTTALQLNDAYFPALLNMSLVLNDQGRCYESLAFSSHAKLLCPDNTEATVEHAYSLLQAGSAQEALAEMNTVEPTLDFHKGRAHHVKARCWEQLSFLEQAEAECLAAARACPRYSGELARLRRVIWFRRVPVLLLRSSNALLAGLDDNLFRLVINRC